LVEHKKSFGEIIKVLYPKEYAKLKGQRKDRKTIKKLDEEYQQLLRQEVNSKTAYVETYTCGKNLAITKGLNLKMKKIWHLLENSGRWTKDETLK
jgi:hypothetical protein